MNRLNQLRVAGMGKPCAVYGCTNAAEGVSPYCRKHLFQNKTQGHPEQHAVRLGAFEKEAQEVVQFLRSKKYSKTGEYFYARLNQIEGFANDQIEQYESGTPKSRIWINASYIIRRVIQKTDKTKIIKRCVGFLIAVGRRPSMVMDERAHRFQLARVFMKALGLTKATERKDAYIPANTLDFMGQLLMEAFLYGAQETNKIMLREKRKAERFPEFDLGENGR